MATVNMPDVPLPKIHVLIKNWSENEGVMEALQSAGIIGPILHEHCNGRVTASKHEVLSADSNSVVAQFEQMRKRGLLGLEDFIHAQFELLVPYKPEWHFLKPLCPKCDQDVRRTGSDGDGSCVGRLAWEMVWVEF